MSHYNDEMRAITDAQIAAERSAAFERFRQRQHETARARQANPSEGPQLIVFDEVAPVTAAQIDAARSAAFANFDSHMRRTAQFIATERTRQLDRWIKLHNPKPAAPKRRKPVHCWRKR